MIRKYFSRDTSSLSSCAVVVCAVLVFGASWCLTPQPAWPARPELPPPSLNIPPMAPVKSVSFYVPSDTAPETGLAVNVIYPSRARYREGAPVAVLVPGGDRASGLSFSMHAAQAGFVEVRFAFPGGGVQGFSSGGTYDHRGMECQKALRDVIEFAAGSRQDSQGRTLQQIVPIKVATNNLGIVGWSNGANTALATLAAYAPQLKSVAWMAFYESPVGSLFYPPTLGGNKDFVKNRRYRQGSAATGQVQIDYRRLRWQPEGQKSPGSHKKAGLPEIEGVLFFDENNNGVWEESFEFAFPYCTHPALAKQIYPPDVTRAMARLKLFPDGWPAEVATVEESEAYFNERDGSLHLAGVAAEFPDLLVTVVGTKIDHLQQQEDHPHIPFLYNAWLTRKIRFVRLNPDPVYVAQIAGMNAGNFVNNTPMSSIDASTIAEHLEPEGLVPDYVFMQAAIAELADRKRNNNTASTSLEEPLISYSNGATASTER